MQTLEEKKALLQRAMDEGLEVRVDDRFTAKVLCVGNIDVFLRFDTDVEESYSMNHFDYHIVEPRVTPEDLCEAIEVLDKYFPEGRMGGKILSPVKEALNLAKRYREQEAE